MNKKSTDEIKPRKSTKTFFSKFWKVASPQPKDDKKKISKSVDNINDINENNVENIKNLSENLNNSRRKSKSLDILNNNVDIEDINIKDNVNFPEVIESDKKEVVNAEEFEQNKINIENQKIIDIESKNKTKVDSVTTDNDNKNEIEENALINNNISQHSSQEPIDGNDLGNNNSKVESINNLSNSKEDNENVLSVVQEEQNLIISDQKEDNSKENNNTIGKEGLNRKSNLTLIIDNNEVINEINGLTPKEFADKLYNTEETEYEGKQISLILTKTDKYHEETLKYYMDNFDFSNIEIDEALRILCKKVVITGETQQIDRILTQFSKHYFDSNPHRHDVFLNEDVTHSIVYSLVLLNTDLHIVYNDNPNKKMTKKEFLKNTMTLLETMSENSFSSQTKIKSANIPSNNRKSYYESKSVTPLSLTSSTLPRNFMESQESKQRKWKKQMEQLLGELYNSIKTKRVIQRTNEGEIENDVSNTSQSSQSVEAYPNKIQSLFGSEKSSYSTFSSVKSLISKGTSRRVKEKSIYLSLPSLNISDSASYNSYGDASYSNKSFDKLNTISKSANGIANNKISNAKIVQKGALNRKHYMDQGKQRAKDRRWTKAHCALFIDPVVSQNGTCELRIWLESSSSSSKKKGTPNKIIDDLFEATANEDDIETQNLPYLNPNYNEVLPITHSVASVVKNYTSFTYSNKKNVFSLKLSSGSTYLFEASDEDTMKTWVNALNFWAARKSREPLRGAVGNMEYGWNQVEKFDKFTTVTAEEIQEAIPIYDPFDNSFDADSIKSYSSSNRDKNSRPSSIRSGRSGRSNTTSSNNRNDSSSINELSLTNITEVSPVKEERTARSFTMKRFRSSSRSTSRHDDSRSKTRSISLNRNESRSKSTTSNVRSYSCTRRPNNKSSNSNSNSNSTGSMPTILSNPNSSCNSPKDIFIKSEVITPIVISLDDKPNGDIQTPLTTSTDPKSNGDIQTPLTAITDNKSYGDIQTPVTASTDPKSCGEIQTSPLTKELVIPKNNEEKEKVVVEEDHHQESQNQSNISSTENEIPHKKLSIPESTSSNNTKDNHNDISSTQGIISPKTTNSDHENNNPPREDSETNKNNSVDETSKINTEKETLKTDAPQNNSPTLTENNNLLHRRILSEPQLRKKREMDKNSIKKRSQSLSQYNENVNKSINSVIVPLSTSTVSVSPDNSKSKLEEPSTDIDTVSQYSTLPYKRSQKVVNPMVSKHQSFIPDKFFNLQRFSLQPGGTLTIKKKIKKLRINDWTQPGVGFLLSTLSLEKQCESMKKQYIITEKELEYHKEIKQPMEDLYVFQSSAYQKACNNWKKKYMYLLDEKNKYGLYSNILENYMKIDPNEEKLFQNIEVQKTINNSNDTLNSVNSNNPSTSSNNKLNNKESTPASQDEIKNILARKRQQQMDIMKKTANDLSIDSGKLENSFVLPEIKVGESLFDDDEYEKEMEELALEQERILNMNK